MMAVGADSDTHKAPMKMNPSTVLITGAASGIGQALAHALSGHAEHLILWDLNEAGLNATVADCGGVPCTVTRIDMTDGAAITRAFESLADAGRTPDLILHAAGVLETGDFAHITPASCRRMVEINYLGTVNLVLEAGRRMGPGGRILCMASIAGFKGFPELGAYAASKFAVVGFCEAVRPDLLRDGIALSIVCPPAIDTPMVRNLASRPVIYDIFPFAPKARVIASILAAVDRRKQFLILVDAQSRLLLIGNGLFPELISRFLSGLVDRKRKHLPTPAGAAENGHKEPIKTKVR